MLLICWRSCFFCPVVCFIFRQKPGLLAIMAPAWHGAAWAYQKRSACEEGKSCYSSSSLYINDSHILFPAYPVHWTSDPCILLFSSFTCPKQSLICHLLFKSTFAKFCIHLLNGLYLSSLSEQTLDVNTLSSKPMSLPAREHVCSNFRYIQNCPFHTIPTAMSLIEATTMPLLDWSQLVFLVLPFPWASILNRATRIIWLKCKSNQVTALLPTSCWLSISLSIKLMSLLWSTKNYKLYVIWPPINFLTLSHVLQPFVHFSPLTKLLFFQYSRHMLTWLVIPSA